MSAEHAAPSTGGALAAGSRLVAAARVQDNRFRIAVALAAAVHAALIFGAMRSAPRQMGERSGRADGISVVLVDAADLQSKNTFREEGAAGNPTRPPVPPAPPQQQPERPKAEDAPAPQSQPSPAPATKMTPAPRPLDEQKSALQAIEKHTLDSLSPPTPQQNNTESAPKPQAKADPKAEHKTEHKTEPKAEPKAEPKPKQSALDLTIPEISVPPGSRGAGVARPPGITRSGENDDFGRGVIRALRMTMPGHTGQFGRVTVKLLLSSTGNLTEVQLLRSAGIPSLDQSVVFAVKQASFPIPPQGATQVDRTFLVTYIYN